MNNSACYQSYLRYQATLLEYPLTVRQWCAQGKSARDHPPSIQFFTWHSTYSARDRKAAIHKYIRRNEVITYLYLITFTFDPKKGKPNEKAAERLLDTRVATKEISSRNIINYIYSKEYTKKGTPHYHLCIESLKTLSKSLFRDWTRKHGNIDFSKSSSNNISNTLIYISKDFIPKIILSTPKAISNLTNIAPRTTLENPEHFTNFNIKKTYKWLTNVDMQTNAETTAEETPASTTSKRTIVLP